MGLLGIDVTVVVWLEQALQLSMGQSGEQPVALHAAADPVHQLL